jgi:hypothetical protein
MPGYFYALTQTPKGFPMAKKTTKTIPLTPLKKKPKTLVELFSDPARWTTNAIARRANGDIVSDSDPLAVSFCLIGGEYLVYPNQEKREAVHARIKAAIVAQGYASKDDAMTVSWFNDTTDHKRLMEVLQAAKA